MLDIKKLDESIARVRKKKAMFEALLTAKFSRILGQILLDAAKVSPQWSGDYAANWRITPKSAGKEDYEKTPYKTSAGPKSRGDLDAVAYAMLRYSDTTVPYREQAVLYNPTPLVFTATTVSDGKQTKRLRVDNVLTPAQTVESYLKAKYGNRRN